MSGAAKDKRVVLVKGKPALEYDHLFNGELAWILGRRFKGALPADAGGAGAVPANALDELNDSQRYANQAYAGLGNGVDRMQRLASTPWVESMIQDKLGKAFVNLHAINLTSAYARSMDPSMESYAQFLAGSTALHAADVTRAVASINAGTRAGAQAMAAAGGERSQGVFVLEMGPFLRGVQVDTSLVDLERVRGQPGEHGAPRNLGSLLSFSAVETEIRRRNLLDWTPDGIVLSKLESPTDEPAKSIEMDARSAQLFNVAIQGPAISTTWTSDNDDPEKYQLECQPMDKVFVCLVADLSYSVDTTAMDTQINGMLAARAAVLADIKNLHDAINANASAAARAPLEAALSMSVAAAEGEADNVIGVANAQPDTPFEVLMQASRAADDALQAALAQSPPPAGTPGLKTAAEAARKAVEDAKKFPTAPADIATAMTDMVAMQQAIRTGSSHVARATLTNFRLKRSTSSHMANYSNFKPGNRHCRCGLNIAPVNLATAGDYSEGTGVAEYIVGAWCIGTVIDSAASRSTVGTLVRTAPTSMAMNINVNIQWWSGDKLYQHYMDSSGLTLMRGQNPPTDPGTGNKRTAAQADLDVDSVGTAPGPTVAPIGPPVAPPVGPPDADDLDGLTGMAGAAGFEGDPDAPSVFGRQAAGSSGVLRRTVPGTRTGPQAAKYSVRRR